MKIIQYLYNKIQDRILTTNTGVKGVQIYMNQDNISEDSLPMAYPQLLIDFGTQTHTKIGQNIRQTDLDINIKLLVEDYDKNYFGALEIANNVDSYLEGWGDWGYYLTLIESSTDINPDSIYTFNFTYQTSIRYTTNPIENDKIPVGEGSDNDYTLNVKLTQESKTKDVL